MRCPVQYITDDSFNAISEYRFYRDGHLPEAGGWLDQPNKVMEQMLIIDGVVKEDAEK